MKLLRSYNKRKLYQRKAVDSNAA